MKGQASTEYLLISVVALAVLAISIGALVKIKENAEKTQDILILKNDAESIYNAMEEVCAMGSGNKRTITPNQKLMIESSVTSVSFSNELGSIPKNLSCESEINGWVVDKITIENENGIIKKK
jgi:uncharacterized protein (UPF0333 family)